MSSLSTTASKLVLALWVVLALAPLAGACLGSDCAVATGVRSAHCGSAGRTMLCCDDAARQPLDVTLTTVPHSGMAAIAERLVAVESSQRHGDPSSVRVAARHGPPLYALFAALLI